MSPGPADDWMNDNMRFHVSGDRSPILKLPLSPGGVNLTDAQRQQYADLVRERVDAILADDERYRARRDQQLPFLHPNEWKQVQVKKSKELRFYKRVRRGRTLDELAAEEEFPEVQQAVKHGYSTMICDGEVKGSLVDMMYGMTASSQEDLMTGFWYKNPPKDCVWLGSAEGPTPEDPFHSADLIWAYLDVPAYQLDICYVKATGVEYDQNGNRFGYLVLHSVELPHCRPFKTHKIFRAKMYFCCLFREIATGVLKVTVRGVLDLQHHVKILKQLVSAATTSFIVGLLNGVGIGEAKKLTMLARRNHRGNSAGNPKKDACSVCLRRSSFLGRTHLLGMYLLQCKVCDATICSSCVASAKQRLFLGSRPCSKFPCCRNCLCEARAMNGVHPADPEFQVVADSYLSSRSRPSFCTNPAQSPTYPLDTVSRTPNPRKSTSKTNLSAGMATNSTADESYDDDPFSRELDDDDFCFSAGDERSTSSIMAQPDPSPESSDPESTLVVWKDHRVPHDDDFVRTAAKQKATARSELEAMHRTLFQLNVAAEKTYKQTQKTMMLLRDAELE